MNSAESLEKVEVYVALGFGSIVLNSIGVDNNVVFTFESNKWLQKKNHIFFKKIDLNNK